MPDPESPESVSENVPQSRGPEVWEWARREYLEPDIARRETQGTVELALGGRAQILFMHGHSPEVRLGTQVRGSEVVESQMHTRKPTGADWVKDIPETDVSNFVLPPEESMAGHLTALGTSSGLDLILSGTAMDGPIKSELFGADEFIESAEAALEGPLGPFASVAYHAAELLARAELLRLPDPRLDSAKTHDSVRARYNLWARFGNTDLRFAALLNSLADWQRNAKYKRTKFSLSDVQAAECMKMLKAMRAHAELRPRQKLSAPPGQYIDLTRKR